MDGRIIRREKESSRIMASFGQHKNDGCEVWGILNVTPDSFSDGGMYLDASAAVARAREMLEQGADVIDVGGESSRPAGAVYGQGAARVSAEEEARRVVPVVRALSAAGARISVDTVKAQVAEEALGAGASIINDVSCGSSAELIRVVAQKGAQLVLMHTRGNGAISAANTSYGDLVAEVIAELLQAASRAEAAGVARQAIWIDPGIGFAKDAEQSLELMAHLDKLVATGYPVLVGPSRKSFIAEAAPGINGVKPRPSERVGGTAAAVAMAAASGAAAVRVHDIGLMRQAALVGHSLWAARARRPAHSFLPEQVQP